MENGIRTVPDRMLGCWKRRYIKFENGEMDSTTRVIWLQALSGMIDIRIPERARDYSKGSCLADYSIEQLMELAEQDCGNATTHLDETTSPYARASWEANDTDVSIQSIVLFPEDGWFDWLEDGECMMEWAPSGAYEEDWRLQSNSRYFIAHYQKQDASKPEFVYLAGDHAVYARDRRVELREQRHLREIVREANANRDYIEALLDIEFSYARRNKDGEFEIELSSLPFREGQRLDLGFLLDMDPDQGQTTYPGSEDTWLRVSQWSPAQEN